MGAPRLDHHRVHDEAGDDRSVGVGPDDLVGHDLFDHDDDAVGGEGRFLLAAQQAPDLGVARGRCPLRVDDRHIRPERRDGIDGAIAVGRGDRSDERVGDRQIRLEIAPQREERQVHGPGRVAGDHPEVAVLLHLQRLLRDLALDPPPDRSQTADTRVPEPRKDKLAGDTGRDHLVVDDVRREAGEGQVAAALADDLVTGRERDEMGEALDGDRIAVVDELGDGVTHRCDLGGAHRVSPPPRPRGVRPPRRSPPGPPRRGRQQRRPPR